jgi:hypothetical protein
MRMSPLAATRLRPAPSRTVGGRCLKVKRCLDEAGGGKGEPPALVDSKNTDVRVLLEAID